MSQAEQLACKAKSESRDSHFLSALVDWIISPFILPSDC